MPIQFRCIHCHKRVQAPDSAAGKKAKCPVCGNVTDVPVIASAKVSDHADSGSEEPIFVPPPLTNSQSFTRYAVAAIVSIAIVIGIGYSIYHQMTWRDRVEAAVEKARADFEKANEPVLREANARIQKEYEASMAKSHETSRSINESIDGIQDRLNRGGYNSKELELLDKGLNKASAEMQQVIDDAKIAQLASTRKEQLDEVIKELDKKLDEALSHEIVAGEPDPFVQAAEELIKQIQHRKYTEQEVTYLNNKLESVISKKINDKLEAAKTKK